MDFSVDAIAVVGDIGVNGETDFYSFTGFQGDLFNFEVLSNALDRLGNDIVDPTIDIFDTNGNAVDYYGVNAFNDDEFETSDSIIIDLVLPSTQTYFIQVGTFENDDVGQYELFAHRFNGSVAVPEPTTLTICGMICLLACGRRRIS